MCGTKQNIYCLLAGIIFSLTSLVSVSTLSYPMSTIMVVFTSLDLMANLTFTCAYVSSSLSLAKTALMLTSMVLIQSLSLFATSLFVDLGYMKRFLSYFYVSTDDLAPEFMRLVLVMAGTIVMVRSFIMFLKAYFLHRQAKERGDTIIWSYKEQGL